MDAQGAVDSLLGRLTSILVNEAQLLGGVRGDVEFIKDEMESMNGLLLHLTEAQHRDHQVRAWMKQIVGLTRDCGGNVELYLQYVAAESGGKQGILGFLLRIPRFLRTVSVRHQIATRIQELKVRARDVGDRRQRYDVTIPRAEPYQYQRVDDRPAPQPGSQEEEEELERRELLDRGISIALELQRSDDNLLKVLPIKNSRARTFYEHSSLVSLFDHRIYADLNTMDYDCNVSKRELEHNIMRQLRQLDEKEYPRGSMILIFLDNIDFSSDSHHSAVENLVTLGYLYEYYRLRIIMSIPEAPDVAKHYYRWKIKYPIKELGKRFKDRALAIIELGKWLEDRALAIARCKVPNAEDICLLCGIGTFALQMFFCLIHVSPNWSGNQMRLLSEDLENNQGTTDQVMLRFCYKNLPSNYKSCLLYLSIFPQDHKIRRTSLLRRWIAEGLVTPRSNLRLKDKDIQGISNLDDEAERVFDALVTRGFLHAEEISAAGKIKTFTVPAIIHNFIVEESSYTDICMPPDLAHRLSINNGVELQEAPFSDHPFHHVLTLLEQITESVPWQLLKVLDLEGCRGLTVGMSVRDTDVNELPKQIEMLQCLETLDIRQTRVQTLSTKQVNFPKLKYFLAGHRESLSNRFSKYKDPFTALRLPRGIRRIKKLQVLSYVDISDNMDDLNDIGELLQLRKLGVILNCKKGSLSALFRQIEKLHGCLRSLSIRISKAPDTRAQATAMDTPPKRLRSLSIQINQRLGGKASAGDTGPQATAMETPPKHLQSLKISGITGGLPLWIAALEQLEEISLSETELGEDAMDTLGNLRILRCLQLLQGSYNASDLKFKSSEFQQLRSLVVEGSITNINFEKGTTPKLRTIVWSFPTMVALSGLDHLPKLKKLELHGDCDLVPVKEAIDAHSNCPVLEHSPRHQHQEDGTAAAEASSSSAP